MIAAQIILAYIIAGYKKELLHECQECQKTMKKGKKNPYITLAIIVESFETYWFM